MMRARRLACLLLPAALVLCLAAPRGETQDSNQDVRFAFADTTLLRDTLGLTFERLFPLADSLRMTPAALKQLSVTYRWTLTRLVKMAESLDVVIDSVGPIMERERFNPLSNVVVNDQMTYSSSFSPQSSGGHSWGNDLDYTVSRGKVFLSNKVTVDLSENGRGGSLGSTEDRKATSSLNWRFSPRFSAGAQMALSRYDQATRSGVNAQSDRINNFGFSMNARPRPWRGLTPNLSLTAGVENQDKVLDSKRGLSGTVNSGLRYVLGNWVSHDVNYSGFTKILSASATDPRPDDAVNYPNARARDNNSTLRGTLNALRGRPVELNVNYQLQNTRTQTAAAFEDTLQVITPGLPDPDTTLFITPLTNKQLVVSERRGLDGTLRFRQGENKSLDVGWRSGLVDNSNSVNVTSTSAREDRSFNTSGRYDAGRLRLQGSFTLAKGINRFPKRDFPRGGYREDSENRNLDGTLNWQATPKLSAELKAGISLNISRYARIDSARTLPVAHDSYEQSYQLDVRYQRSQNVSTSTGLRVSRAQYVNLPAASTASNTDSRTYRATWSWSYRLLPGLTATQNNALSAVYTAYPFAPASNRLQLDYGAVTTLNAVLNPRLSIDLNHQAKYQPSGNFRPLSAGDPTEYFSRADETRINSLDARIYYTPTPGFSMNLTPSYNANSRSSNQDGTLAPQRDTRGLNLSGGASLNLPVGRRGKLSGNINRTLQSSRTVSYATAGTTDNRTELRTVSGTLTFTWTL